MQEIVLLIEDERFVNEKNDQLLLIEKNDVCSICLCAYSNNDILYQTVCNHFFHKYCVVLHFWEYPDQCPLCRQPAYGNFVPPCCINSERVQLLENTIDALKERIRTLDERIGTMREKMDKKRISISPPPHSIPFTTFCIYILLTGLFVGILAWGSGFAIGSYMKEKDHQKELAEICMKADPSWRDVCLTKYRQNAHQQFCDQHVPPSWRFICKTTSPETMEALNELAEHHPTFPMEIALNYPNGCEGRVIDGKAMLTCKTGL